MNGRARRRQGVGGGDAELSHHVRGTLAYIQLVVRAEEGAGDVLPPSFPRSNDDTVVAIGTVRCLRSDHDVGVEVQDCAGVALTPRIPNGYHAEFDAQRAASLVAGRPDLLARKLSLEILDAMGLQSGYFFRSASASIRASSSSIKASISDSVREVLIA